MKPISFEAWIDEMGINVLAELLDVHPQTIRHWRAKRCDPYVKYLRVLRRLSRGRLTYEAMIDRATPTNRYAAGVRR